MIWKELDYIFVELKITCLQLFLTKLLHLDELDEGEGGLGGDTAHVVEALGHPDVTCTYNIFIISTNKRALFGHMTVTS